MKGIGAKQRAQVWAKSQGRCWYCGDPLNPKPGCWHLNQFTPRKVGGRRTLDNLVPACPSCGHAKGGRTVEEFRDVVRVRNVRLSIYFSPRQLAYLESVGFGIPLPPKPVFYFEHLGLTDAGDTGVIVFPFAKAKL